VRASPRCSWLTELKIVFFCSALAATINRFVDKNGRISSFSAPQGAQPVHYLRGLLLGEQAGIIPVQVWRIVLELLLALIQPCS